VKNVEKIILALFIVGDWFQSDRAGWLGDHTPESHVCPGVWWSVD
jgi:hypothetical protein